MRPCSTNCLSKLEQCERLHPTARTISHSCIGRQNSASFSRMRSPTWEVRTAVLLITHLLPRRGKRKVGDGAGIKNPHRPFAQARNCLPVAKRCSPPAELHAHYTPLDSNQ